MASLEEILLYLSNQAKYYEGTTDLDKRRNIRRGAEKFTIQGVFARQRETHTERERKKVTEGERQAITCTDGGRMASHTGG
ncbi:hypothetical protein J4Q44_G00166880 [Coregonus suidteri]|uniref:Uncharacterized protein n=1 Tax=Coregonus suidteri TaxID=861788 RepID=A0AAN8QVV3_9TELE